ncbi:hypothetical protein [Paraliomyxa miuraensis]|uniref:hypothetical protein n=1 Tax=Paraliomyxa miuraensis TaxID=376150 RepID=UPI0022577508|nr:hypothetical protein [Paraliomyxa miuraensis]MCX4239843.1 hypothetical protein [Paraliomyxa miuraensis]
MSTMLMLGAPEAAAEAPAGDGGGDEYEAVEGIDRETIECQRSCEAVAARKTASDYEHIVWAYGVLWSLFAIYGLMLWRRGQRLQGDVASLQAKLGRS